MDSVLQENSTLKKLIEFFNYHLQNYLKEAEKDSESTEELIQNIKDNRILSRYKILEIFFNYNLFDTCGYNIYHINEFINQINTSNDEINLQKFLTLIFYIYKIQTLNEGVVDSEINELSMENINEISANMKKLNSEENNNMSEIPVTNNIIEILFSQYEQKSKFFDYVIPDFKNEDIKLLLEYDSLRISEKYMKSLAEKLYFKYCDENEEKNIFYLNLSKLNKVLTENHITSLFKGSDLLQYTNIFTKINTNKITDNDLKERMYSFFEKSLTNKEVYEIFEDLSVTVEKYNFNFSAFALLIAVFAIHLPSTQNEKLEEKLRFFYEDILYLKSSDYINVAEENLEEEKQESNQEEFLPESKTLNTAKQNRGKYSKDDNDFVADFLFILDKILPPEDENILSFANDYDNPAQNIYTVKENKKIPKFPVEKLAVEIEEEKEKILLEKEKKQIEKAKKVKKNQKEKRENPYDAIMDEVPNIKNYDEKYLGKEKIDTLTHRLIKHTYKELLPNSGVYPSLLKEVLVIPPNCPHHCMESIVESMAEQVNGKYEYAIRRLEKAQDFLPKEIGQVDWQTDLFFNLSFGSLYEILDFDLIAMKYYSEAVSNIEKLINVDTDMSLPFCFLGELFVKLQEYNWAMRCFLKAKNIREETLGCETPDTASVYNNLGVVAYCLESYLPAKGFFKLSYEIYKSILGLTHPRTMLIKSNLTKMNQLNFNKQVQFKTLSKYATPAQFVKNDRKKK